MKMHKKRRFGTFFIIAIFEHIILVIFLAAAIYTPVPEKDDSGHVEVEMIVDMPLKQEETPEEKVEINTYLAEDMAPIPDELPTFQFDRTGGYGPSAPDFDIPMPNAPRRAAADVNPDKMLLRSPSTRNVERGARRDSTGRLKYVRPTDNPGKYSAAPRDILPESGKGRITAGQSGPTTSRYVSKGTVSGASRKVGIGPGGVNITGGTVKGRLVEYWPDIPERPGKESGEVALKFWVTPQGNVSKVEIRTKAGDPSLEKLAKEFVKAIKFAPLSKRKEQKNQWGEITIDFTQKRVK